MRLNNNQNNMTFQQNILVRFPTSMLQKIPRADKRNAVLRKLAKEIAVSQGKIDSVDNVGLALFVDEANLLVLVLDKTVETSKGLRIAFDELRFQLRLIADMKRSERFDKFKPDAQERILKEKVDRRVYFKRKLAEEAAKVKETIDYAA